jgi:sulfite oxidase
MLTLTPPADCCIFQAQPFNAVPSLSTLRRSFITPAEFFFARNHAPFPEIDLQQYRLLVTGQVAAPLGLSLSDLRARFPRREVVATLMCAGNRRQELITQAPVPNELPWNEAALSTAEWGGYRLGDVLDAAGLRADTGHVAFVGLDRVETHGPPFGFGGSVPLEKVLNDEVLLADEMNGQPLPALHGAPLRVIVPGYIGARSVKWVETITVQAGPSDNYYQAQAYKLFPAHIQPASAPGSAGLMIGEWPINAVICEPAQGAVLPAGRVTLRGYALTSDGRDLARVEVSGDGGRTWQCAELVSKQARWAWRFWEATLTLPTGTAQLMARAWDAAANTQPESIAQVWNFKGYLNNAWHRVRVQIGEPSVSNPEGGR